MNKPYTVKESAAVTWWHFFPGLCLFLTVIGFTTTLISSFDIWWHLGLGREVFLTRKIIFPDNFSYTFFGQDQFSGEWLANLLMYLSYVGGGIWGITFLKNLLLVLTFFIQYHTLALFGKKEERPLWRMAVVLTLLIALFALRFRLFIRPYLFSYVGVSFFLYILYRYRITRNPRLLYVLPLVEIIWANLSSGLFFGPVLTGTFFVAELIRKKVDYHLLLVFFLVLAASCCSPEFVGPYASLFQFSQARFLDRAVTLVGEHQPLTTDLLWGSGLSYTLGFQVLAFCSIVYFLFYKGWRNLPQLFLFVLFIVPAFRWIRMIDFFSLNATVFAVMPVYRLLRFSLRRVTGNSTRLDLISGMLVLVIGFTAVFGTSIYRFGFGVKEKSLPEKALNWLDENRVTGRIFNSYSYGAYIIWATPQRKVFIDGRVNHLYPTDFHQGYFQIIQKPGQWKEAEKKWGFTVAVLEYDQMSLGRHFPLHLNTNPDWVPVFWNNESVIFLKQVPENRELISRYGFNVARPYFYDFMYLSHLPAGADRGAVVNKLRSDVSRNPDNQEARLALVFLYNSINFNYYIPLIEDELLRCLKLAPDIAAEHSALAFVYLRKGQRKQAEVETGKALDLDPNDPAALELKNLFGL